jgi:hypothetical protein
MHKSDSLSVKESKGMSLEKQQSKVDENITAEVYNDSVTLLVEKLTNFCENLPHIFNTKVIEEEKEALDTDAELDKVSEK